MANEQTNKSDTTRDEANSEAPLSIVDEAKKIRDEIVRARDELRAENDRADKRKAEEMLGGTSGGRVDPQPPKEETPAELADKVLNNTFEEKK